MRLATTIALGVLIAASRARGQPALPDTRDASGTSWQPDSTPMFMWHASAGAWALALHENAMFGFDAMGSTRGADQFVTANWVMGMASHALGGGDLTLRAMLSAEPLLLPGDGYPLLLQTGESWHGVALHDRQHPHDLFMELAARVREPLGDGLALELYVAPSGEPPVGPTAFPHRFTSMADPLAPLGHHWQDATHISFGVLTAGLFTRRVKLEGSWFNGREPDEDRLDLDLRTPDSVAARVTVNPTDDLSAQMSWARLAQPEALEPGVSVQRATASVTWNRRFAGDAADVAVTAVYGRDMPSGEPATNAGLVEAILLDADRHTVFGRAELLEKTGLDLVLPPELAERTFGMASLSLGFVEDFPQVKAIVPGIGVAGMLDVVGADLAPFYGTRAPVAGVVFVRLRPPEMKMHHMAMHSMTM